MNLFKYATFLLGVSLSLFFIKDAQAHHKIMDTGDDGNDARWCSNPSGPVPTGPLHGTYTVGGANADFDSLIHVVMALNAYGVDSTVVFNILPGIYDEKLYLSSISGTNPDHTVTFRGAGALTKIKTLTDQAHQDVIRLSGTKHVIFDSLWIESTAPDSTCVIRFFNGSDSNVVRNCSVIVALNTYNADGILFAGTLSGHDTGGTANHNRIENNYISGGFTCIFLRGDSNYAGNNVITGNECVQFTKYAIFCYYQEKIWVEKNFIHDPYGFNVEAIRLEYLKGWSIIEGNKVHCIAVSSVIGIATYNVNTQFSLQSDSCLITNNMINILDGTFSFGMSIVQLHNGKILSNTVNLRCKDQSTAFQYLDGDSVIVENNIFTNFGSGYALVVTNASGNLKSDFNDLYSPLGYFAKWNNTSAANLPALQVISGKDSNSVSVDPMFVAEVDLHVISPFLYRNGKHHSMVLYDFDGETRNDPPCLGADEFILVPNDIGIFSCILPPPVCPGDTTALGVAVFNYGNDSVFNGTVHWSVNGIWQSPASFSCAMSSGEIDTVTLGSYVFYSGITYHLEFYTSNPNGMNDLNPANDTIHINPFKTALIAGTYSVGISPSADFNAIETALQDLHDFGICGSVVFGIDTGSYNAAWIIENIPGTSATNTITFKSMDGDSSKVVFHFTAIGNNNTAITLKDQSYVTIEGITLNVNGPDVAKGIEFKGISRYNTIRSCVFNLQKVVNQNITGIYTDNQGTDLSHSRFINNVFRNGHHGFYFYLNGSSPRGNDFYFENNQFLDNYSNCIVAFYADSVFVYNNTFIHNDSSANKSAVVVFGGKNTIIQGNMIRFTSNAYVNGINFYDVGTTGSFRNLVANNMIYLHSPSQNCGMVSAGSNIDIFYNTVKIAAGNTQATGIILKGSGYNVKNNNLVSTGYTYYLSYPTAPQISDYNNLYTTGPYLGYYMANRATLADFQSATGKETNSINVCPKFWTGSNLHLYTNDLNNIGTPLTTIQNDIDGDQRDSISPDIGADEFEPVIFDLHVDSIIAPVCKCEMSHEDVMVRLINTGTDTLSGNAVLKLSICDGTSVISENAWLAMNPGDTILYTYVAKPYFGSLTDSIFNLLAWVEMPTDSFPANDTARASVSNFIRPPAPSVTGTPIAFGNSTTISATSSYPVYWFDADTVSVLLGVGNTYSTGNLFDTTVFYCAALAANGCLSAFSPDTVYVTGIPPIELGISDLYVNEGCGSDTAESVTIEIYNRGYLPSNGIATATFKLDNQSWVAAENITDTIDPKDTIIFVFNQRANLKNNHLSDTLFSIISAVAVSGDTYSSNDTLLKSSILSKYTPYNPTVYSPLTVLKGSAALLIGSSPDSLIWLTSPNDTVPFASGSHVFTNPLFADTTFYAGAIIKSSNDSITTTLTGTSTYPGNMFDVTATNPVMLDSFAVRPSTTGTMTIAVYYKLGTYSGFESNASAWTLLGTAVVNNTGLPSGSLVNVPVGGLSIKEGETFGIYITRTSGSLRYTSISTPKLYLSDDNATVTLGSGVYYPFGTTYAQRAWNGKIFYKTNTIHDCRSDAVPVVVLVDTLLPVDAGLYSATSLAPHTTAKVPVPIEVNIMNHGRDTLVSADVVYELDGVVKKVFSWTGSLPTGDTTGAVLIYTDTLSSGYHHAKLWVTNPNSTFQGSNSNDTIGYYFTSCFDGNYTIGDSLSDFQTLEQAIAHLDSAGVCGNVVFKIKPGNYVSLMHLKNVEGMDSSSTVTFTSLNNDSTSVIISNDTASGFYVVYFDDASYFTFKNLTINKTGSTPNHSIVFANNANHINIENCVIKNNNAGAVFSAIYDDLNSVTEYISVKHCHIKGGYFGMYFQSNVGENAIHAIQNVFDSVDGGAIRFIKVDHFIVAGNSIHANGVATFKSAMFFQYNYGHNEITSNNIYVNASWEADGIGIYSSRSGIALSFFVANNMINVVGGSHLNHGIFLQDTRNVSIIYNSVKTSSTQNYSLLVLSSANITIYNNILYNDGSGYVMYVDDDNTATSDYNDFHYINGSNFIMWKFLKMNLSAHQTTTGQDLHSMVIDPGFLSTSDLHVYTMALDGAAMPLAQVAEDIDGDLRNTTNPDIGADEFDFILYDAVPVEVIKPCMNSLALTYDTVKVKITSSGYLSIDSIPLSYCINGGIPVNETWHIGGAGLCLHDTGYYSFQTPCLVPDTAFVICVNSNLPGDLITSNDTLCQTVQPLDPLFDVGIISITSPPGIIPINQPANVEVRLYNYGPSLIDKVNVQYQANTGMPILELWNGGFLNQGDSADYIFNTPFTPISSSYQLCVRTVLLVDSNSTNDEMCKNFLIDGLNQESSMDFQLWQNTPNPCQEKTNIQYSIPIAGTLDFEVQNLLGATLYKLQRIEKPGTHGIELDVSNFSNGVYCYRIIFDGKMLHHKLIVNK